MTKHVSKLRIAVVALLVLGLLEVALKIRAILPSYLPDGQSTLITFISECVLLLATILLFAVPLILAEQLMPRTQLPKFRLRALIFWTAYVPFSILASKLIILFFTQFHITPIFNLGLNSWHLQGISYFFAHLGILFIGLIFLDFCYYWFHRMQHQFPFLWRFHQAHHANSNLNALSCYHHPFEDILRIPFFTVPMVVLLKVDAPQMLIFSALTVGWAYFCHADSTLNVGALRCVITDNQYHRIHHSTNPDHFGRNFAFYFSLMDRLFGTQKMPSALDIGCEVGLSDVPNLTRLRELFALPFVRRQKPNLE